LLWDLNQTDAMAPSLFCGTCATHDNILHGYFENYGYLSPVISVAFLTSTMAVTFATTYFLYDDNTKSICKSLGYDCDVATTSDIPTISFTFVPHSNWALSAVGLSFASVFALLGLRDMHQALRDEVVSYLLCSRPRIMDMPACLCLCIWCSSYEDCCSSLPSSTRDMRVQRRGHLEGMENGDDDAVDASSIDVQLQGEGPCARLQVAHIESHSGDERRSCCSVPIDLRISICSWIATVCAVLMGAVGVLNLRVNYYLHSSCAGIMFSAGLVWLFTVTSIQHQLFRRAPPAAQIRSWRYSLKSAGVWLMVLTFVVNIVLGLLMQSPSWQGVEGLNDWSVWSQNALNEYSVATALALGVCSASGDILAYRDRQGEGTSACVETAVGLREGGGELAKGSETTARDETGALRAAGSALEEKLLQKT